MFSLFPVLNSMLGRRGGDLSGGQQQQLAIGRALVMRPRLLLLDEPTEGIQPSIIKDIGRAIAYLRGLKEMAIVLVEQYLDFAQELGDQLVVMDRGSNRLFLRHAPAWTRARSSARWRFENDARKCDSSRGNGREDSRSLCRTAPKSSPPIAPRGHIALGVAARAGRTRRTSVHEDGSLRVRFPNAAGRGAGSGDRQHRRRHDRRRPFFHRYLVG